MDQSQQYFKVPEQYVGKSLKQIADMISSQGGYVPDIGAIQQVSGISADSPLNAGQYIGFRNDPGAGEYKFLTSNFGAPISSSAYQSEKTTNDLISQANKLREFNIQAAQPQIEALGAAKTDLEGQYQNLLASIRGDQQASVNKRTQIANNELGKRGIVGSSTMAQQNLADTEQEAAQPFNTLLANTQIGQAQDLANIASQIAALQAGNPEGATAGAFNIANLVQQAQQLAQQQANQNKSFEFQQQELDLARQQANKGSTGSDFQIVSAGGRTYLYDKATGQYQVLGGGGGNLISDPY